MLSCSELSLGGRCRNPKPSGLERGKVGGDMGELPTLWTEISFPS